jgi:hypothetical protein
MSGVDTAYARVVVGSALLGVNAPSFLVWAPPFIPGVVRGHGILEVHKGLLTQRVLHSRGPKRGGKPPEKASLDLRSDEVEFPCLIDFVEDFAGRHGLPESELSPRFHARHHHVDVCGGPHREQTFMHDLRRAIIAILGWYPVPRRRRPRRRACPIENKVAK